MTPPTQEECWSDFWEKVATIYAALPHENAEADESSLAA